MPYHGEIQTRERPLDQLLRAEDPLAKLRIICPEIPYSFSHQEVCDLKQSGQADELIYRCLPTLLASLENYGGFGVSRRKLFEEGFSTLVESVRSWDPNRKLKSGQPDWLKGFVSRNVKRSLEETIAKTYGLKGGSSFPLVRLYRECWQEFIDEKDKPPSLKEISDLVRLRNKKGLGLEFNQRGGKRISKIEIMYSSNQPPIPLIEAKKELVAPSPEESAEKSSLSKQILEVLDSLSNRERRVLELRFGLIDGHSMTLEEVGKALGLSKERIGQIEGMALKKLRHPSKSQKLRDFL